MSDHNFILCLILSVLLGLALWCLHEDTKTLAVILNNSSQVVK